MRFLQLTLLSAAALVAAAVWNNTGSYFETGTKLAQRTEFVVPPVLNKASSCLRPPPNGAVQGGARLSACCLAALGFASPSRPVFGLHCLALLARALKAFCEALCSGGGPSPTRRGCVLTAAARAEGRTFRGACTLVPFFLPQVAAQWMRESVAFRVGNPLQRRVSVPAGSCW